MPLKNSVTMSGLIFAAAVEIRMMREQDPDDEPKASNEVTAVNDEPVAQHLGRGNLAARPGHHDQVVAGEQLGASDQDDR